MQLRQLIPFVTLSSGEESMSVVVECISREESVCCQVALASCLGCRVEDFRGKLYSSNVVVPKVEVCAEGCRQGCEMSRDQYTSLHSLCR